MSIDLKDQIKPNPSDFVCPLCSIPMPKRVSMLGRSELKKGTIFVCSNCSGLSVLGDTNLHPMTANEFKSLPEQSKRALYITKTEIERRLKAGGEWSPYEKK